MLCLEFFHVALAIIGSVILMFTGDLQYVLLIPMLHQSYLIKGKPMFDFFFVVLLLLFYSLECGCALLILVKSSEMSVVNMQTYPKLDLIILLDLRNTNLLYCQSTYL